MSVHSLQSLPSPDAVLDLQSGGSSKVAGTPILVPPKRRRGRPPKRKPLAPPDLQSGGISKVAGTPILVPRKRRCGRPPKRKPLALIRYNKQRRNAGALSADQEKVVTPCGDDEKSLSAADAIQH